MDLFRNAKTIRLRSSHHDKYLLAEDDQEGVCQDRHGGGTPRARWTVEYVKGGHLSLVRLKSCYGKYLLATEEPFFMGVTGKKVVQSLPQRLDSSVEWEPIRDAMNLKLKTRYGNYLRANGGVPPWRNSITHDVPSRSHTQDWILWQIEVLESYPPEEVAPVAVKVKLPPEDEPDPEPFTPDLLWTPKEPGGNAIPLSPLNGRIVHYNIVDNDGNVDQGNTQTLNFKGLELEDLKKALEEETGLKDVIVCSQNPLNGKLNPLRLDLPPHHVKMHVFLVPPTSKVAGDLVGPTTLTAP